MARKATLVHTVQVRLDGDLNTRLETVATAAEVWKADVVRDALIAILPVMEAQLGLHEVESDEPERPQGRPAAEDRSAGCFGGPSVTRSE